MDCTFSDCLQVWCPANANKMRIAEGWIIENKGPAVQTREMRDLRPFRKELSPQIRPEDPAARGYTCPQLFLTKCTKTNRLNHSDWRKGAWGRR
jgi:hypothetical protein